MNSNPTMTVDKKRTITAEQIDYANQVLMEKLQEEAGKYIAQEMVKRQADNGDSFEQRTKLNKILKESK